MFASCGLPAFRPAWNEYEVNRDETLLVGKIEFDPPLTAEGRDLRAAAADLVAWDGVWMICGNRMRIINVKNLSPDSPDFSKKISATQGDAFYYVIAGAFYKNIHRINMGRGVTGEFEAILLPAGFYIDIKNQEEAVYIGTIRYTLDSAYNTTKIEVLDDFDREMPMFRRIFGAMKIRKALVKPPKLKAVMNPESMI
jgi:hypothetical protein